MVFFPVAGIRTDRSAVGQALAEVCQRVEAQNSPYAVSIGVGPATPTIDEFPHAYRAAMQSLELGRLLHPRKSGRVTSYEELGVFRLLSPTGRQEDIRAFCRDALGPVLAVKDPAPLLATLRAYLENGQNLRRTAQTLGIHYNTARYRLRRLRHLLGPALDDPPPV